MHWICGFWCIFSCVIFVNLIEITFEYKAYKRRTREQQRTIGWTTTTATATKNGKMKWLKVWSRKTHTPQGHAMKSKMKQHAWKKNATTFLREIVYNYNLADTLFMKYQPTMPFLSLQIVIARIEHLSQCLTVYLFILLSARPNPCKCRHINSTSIGCSAVFIIIVSFIQKKKLYIFFSHFIVEMNDVCYLNTHIWAVRAP